MREGGLRAPNDCSDTDMGDAEPTEAQRVDLRGAPATLLITLYAKALDCRSPHPALRDERATRIVELIDYDFEQLTGLGDSAMMPLRARQHDEWLRGSAAHADAVVLNLGCDRARADRNLGSAPTEHERRPDRVYPLQRPARPAVSTSRATST